MSLFSRAEKRASTSGPAADWARDVFMAGKTSNSGQDVDKWEAETLPAVYFCQSLIADGIASFPRDVVRKKKDGSTEVIKSPKWLDNPNSLERGFSFWHKVVISVLGDGNAFIRIMRDGDAETGPIRELHVIHPYAVEMEQIGDEVVFKIGDTGNGDPVETLTRSRMIHIGAFSKPGELRAVSPIDAARETVGMALAAEEFGARFFSQGTTMAGVIEHPGNPKPTEVALLRKMFRKTHAGTKNSHAIGILTGGARWTSIAVTPEQAQFLETRKYQDVQIGKLYRVPAYMLDPAVTSSWGSGVEEQNKFFVTWTLMPWISRIEEAISELLPAGQSLKLNTRAMMRGKDADRALYYQSGLANAWLTPDDIRLLEDLSPLPDGNGEAFYRPANLVEIGAEPAPALTDPAGAGGDDPNDPTQAKPDATNGNVDKKVTDG